MRLDRIITPDRAHWENMDPRTDYNRIVMADRVCSVETWNAELRTLGCGKPAAVELRCYMENGEYLARYALGLKYMVDRLNTEAGIYHTTFGDFRIYVIFWPCRDCYGMMVRAAVGLGDAVLVEELMGPQHGRPSMGRHTGRGYAPLSDQKKVMKVPTSKLPPGQHRGILAPNGTLAVEPHVVSTDPPAGQIIL